MGPRRARAAADRHDPRSASALAVAGVCGALDPALAPGSVFVPEELRTDDGQLFSADAAGLADALRARGIEAHSGALVGADHILRAAERPALFASGARAVDMESPWLAAAAAGRPFAVLRVVSDGPGAELWSLGVLRNGWRALAMLRRAAPALADWARARTSLPKPDPR
jgi:4-hydroxy-3-methylbut-2-enyl diphosphate reductase